MYFGSNRGWMAMGWMAIIGFMAVVFWIVLVVAAIGCWLWKHVRWV